MKTKTNNHIANWTDMFERNPHGPYKTVMLSLLICFMIVHCSQAQPSEPPYYKTQLQAHIDPTSEVFIIDSKGLHAWASTRGDYGAIRVIAINDNQDTLRLGTPMGHFTGNQGLVVAYDVYDVFNESGNGAVCALGTAFPASKGGPGFSGLPETLKDTILNVDISFQIPEDPSIEVLTNALSFWLIEADGDDFETEGILDLNREWKTYTYNVNDLANHVMDASGGGIFGDSPVALFAIQFEDPDNISGISSIIYSIDNFQLSGSATFFEDFEDSCPVIPAFNIDIKPGSYPNSINLGSRGLTAVAILTSDHFDASTVDLSTVALAGAPVAVRGKGKHVMASLEDVDGDGDLDLLVHVETQDLDLTSDSTQAALTAQTYNGIAVEGSDSVRIVPME